jgi:hypothetical protein
MNPNFTTLLVLVGLVLSLFAGELFRYFTGTVISKIGAGRCRKRCGEFGWTVARKDTESCHAVCVKCGWMNHFDAKQWKEVNKR